MKTVCEVDVAPLVKMLPDLGWLKGGEPGTYAALQGVLGDNRAKLRGASLCLTWPPEFPAEAFCDALMKHYPGKRRGEINIHRVVPGQQILDHCDNLEGGCQIRVHIPLTTNSKAMFREAGKATHMAVGKAYEINPSKKHGIENTGKTDRIHLMFNVL